MIWEDGMKYEVVLASCKVVLVMAILTAIFVAAVINTKQYETEYTTTHHTDIESARDTFDECLDTYYEGATTSVSFDTRLKAIFNGTVLKEGKYKVVCGYVWGKKDALKK